MSIKAENTGKGIVLREEDTGKLAGSVSTVGKKPPTVSSPQPLYSNIHPDKEEPIATAYDKFQSSQKIGSQDKNNLNDYFVFSLQVSLSENGEHTLIAAPKGQEASESNKVGWLDWDGRSGRIEHIEVKSNHQRQGIATALYREAIRLAKEKDLSIPRHSAVRTTDGDRWANSIGDHVPEIECSWCSEEGHSGSECPDAWAD